MRTQRAQGGVGHRSPITCHNDITKAWQPATAHAASTAEQVVKIDEYGLEAVQETHEKATGGQGVRREACSLRTSSYSRSMAGTKHHIRFFFSCILKVTSSDACIIDLFFFMFPQIFKHNLVNQNRDEHKTRRVWSWFNFCFAVCYLYILQISTSTHMPESTKHMHLQVKGHKSNFYNHMEVRSFFLNILQGI